jgi:hypothetical protein
MTDIKNMYMFVSQDEEDWASIMIKDGKFKDVIYSYGKVSVPQEEDLNENGTMPFRFEYNIVDNVGIPRSSFDEEFFTLIGDILVDIIGDQSNVTDT